MARDFSDYDGTITPVSGAYPNGDIKDNIGGFNGTICNRKSSADIWQFFFKLIRLAGITLNGLPDNETNDFQFVKAAKNVIGVPKIRQFIDGVAVTTPVFGDYSPIVRINPAAANGHTVELHKPTGAYTGKATVMNGSAHAVDIVDENGDNVNGGATFVLAPGEAAEIKFSNPNWVLENYYLGD